MRCTCSYASDKTSHPRSYATAALFCLLSTASPAPTMTESIRKCHYGGASTSLSQHARTITIKHPGYSPAEDLLCFPAYDNTPALWGYSHLLVLDACRIIANNRDGFVSTTPHRSDRVPADEHTLAAGVYYYFLGDDSDPPYPVNACFDTWSFPDTLPAHWRTSRAAAGTTRRSYGTSESDVSAQVQIAGDTCVISGDSKRNSSNLSPKCL